MDMESVPRPVEALKSRRVRFVAAGTSHAIAVTDDGEVYAWGMGTWTEPHLMTALRGTRIVSGSCGHNFSVVVSDVGEVFSWGKGFRETRAGTLGHGPGEAANKPTKQPSRIETFRHNGSVGAVCRVVCGSWHALAMVGALPTRES